MAVVAGEVKNGTDVVLFVKMGTPAAWVPLACLKTNNWEGSSETIDTSSKCSGKFATAIAGSKSWSMSADGNAINETAQPSQASFKSLSKLWADGVKFPMKMVGVDDPDDTISGDVILTSLSKSANHNELVGFSATFQGTGAVSFAPVV